MIDDVNLRYRNTFTTEQKLVWINDYELELFEIFEIDAPPYNFMLVEGENYYPIPDEVNIDKIKVMTIERGEGNYQELPFMRNDNKQHVSESEYWFTIVSDLFYINIPGGAKSGQNIYIYHDINPTKWETSNLDMEPDTPRKYQEILKLHLLEMIAGARKDVVMKNNFLMDKEKKIEDFLWQMKMSEPEFISAADVSPKAGRGRRYSYVER